MLASESQRRGIYVASLCLLLAIGVFLRLPPQAFSHGPLHSVAAAHPMPMFSSEGFDEALYQKYVNSVSREGLTSYPEIVEHYIEVQKNLPGSILPPLRFLFIFAAFLWHQVFDTEALGALHNVASLFSILTLLFCTVFVLRLQGPAAALAITGLIAVAPTQIHMSQHALIDGFFTFWALLTLWLVWENLRLPGKTLLLVSYLLALALLVLTKENSFFVWVAVLAIILLNRFFQFGTVTRELLIATIVGPLLGLVMLVFLAGGIDNFITSYRLSISKNYQLTYAILTGDGPWSRYLIDLLLVSPVVLLLAIGRVFQLKRSQKPEIFLTIFVAASYMVMCNIKYGMNLRYANMWDMPLRFLAFSQIVLLVSGLRRHRTTVIGLAIGLICLLELRQYIVLFVHYPLYELVSEGLLRALHVLKSP